MNQSYLRRIYLRLAGVVMLIVMLALAANAFVSHRSFERALAPDMAKKVATVGASIRSLVLMVGAWLANGPIASTIDSCVGRIDPSKVVLSRARRIAAR